MLTEGQCLWPGLKNFNSYSSEFTNAMVEVWLRLHKKQTFIVGKDHS